MIIVTYPCWNGLRLTLKQSSLLLCSLERRRKENTQLEKSTRGVQIRRSKRTTPSIYRGKGGGGRKILLPKGRNTISIVVDDERFILEYYGDGEERNWTLCERAP
jgi:hypothetical protein